VGRRPAQHAPPDVLVVGGVVGVATVDDIIDNGNAEECKLKGGLRSSGGGGGHKLQFKLQCVATKVSWFFLPMVVLFTDGGCWFGWIDVLSFVGNFGQQFCALANTYPGYPGYDTWYGK